MQQNVEHSRPMAARFTPPDDPTSPEAVGYRLRILRKAEAWEQHDAVRELRCTRQAWSAWEVGKRAMPASAALSIARITGFPFEWIMAGDRKNLSDEQKIQIRGAEKEIESEDRGDTPKRGRPRSEPH